MSKVIKIKLSTEYSKVDDLNNLIIDSTKKIPNLEEASFAVDKLEVRGLDNSIIEIGKIIITFNVDVGIGISTIIVAIGKAILDYMKTTKGNVTIINKDKEIKLENFTEEEIIVILESINQTKVN